MEYTVPYTNRPEDITRLLDLLTCQAVPNEAIEAGTINKWGFTPVSSGHLVRILQQLGFIDSDNRATDVWKQYAAEENRGVVLASALKKAYSTLFKNYLCPYLEDDYNLTDCFQQTLDVPLKDANIMVKTFQYLAEKADFQDLLEEEAPKTPAKGTLPETSIKVNPNLQLNIQIHIDPQTPDEKIEAIFKNMQKYLLNKNT
jgi:hypothetical protein